MTAGKGKTQELVLIQGYRAAGEQGTAQPASGELKGKDTLHPNDKATNKHARRQSC